jgi:hypothetical protein
MNEGTKIHDWPKRASMSALKEVDKFKKNTIYC